ICEAKFGVLFRYDGTKFFPAAWLGVPPAYDDSLRQRQRGLFRPDEGTPLDRLLRTKELIQTADESAEQNPGPAAKVAHGHLSPCRCPRRRSWSVPSSSTARKSGRSPTSRSRWLRTLRVKPSSPSRTPGC